MTRSDFKKQWNTFVTWRGWKWIFPMPLWLAVLAFLGCCAVLVWIFARGMDQTVPAYAVYAASAYSLCALCVRLPGVRGRQEQWLTAHPKAAGILRDRELRFRVKLYSGQIIDSCYGVFKIAAGVVIGSAWIGCDGIYNMAQAIIQLFQILRRKNPGSMTDQWKSYRLCGVLTLLMNLTLTGIIFQMLSWGRVEEHGEIMLISTAAFAFYKLIKSFIRLARDRKHEHPIDSAVWMLENTQALFAMFSLQAGLLHTYGTGERWEPMMNLATGSVVWLAICATGIKMICRANREIKALQETEHGA